MIKQQIKEYLNKRGNSFTVLEAVKLFDTTNVMAQSGYPIKKVWEVRVRRDGQVKRFMRYSRDWSKRENFAARMA